MHLPTFKLLEMAYFSARSEVVENTSWEQLIHNGFKYLAMAKYQRVANVNLKEAKRFIDEYSLLHNISERE